MAKHQQDSVWARLRAVSSWYFVLVLIISSAVAVVALRHNNFTALQLRDHVNQVDQQNGDVEKALRDLRQYVYGHMNTDLSAGPNAIKPPIQLKYRYERLLAAQQSANANTSTVYTDAQNYCEKQIPNAFSGRSRVPCIQDYVTSHGVQTQPIPDALYKFDFVSPVWSPDLAGWSLVIVALCAILLIVRLSMEYWLRRMLIEHA